MNLPINQATLYSITIPSTGKKVQFRQFLVKEQKALLIAQQSKDEEVMYHTLKEVVKSCVKGSVDIDKLAIFDVEYLFIMMRAKSVGELAEIVIMCPNCDDEKAKTNLTINLEQVQVSKNPEHTNKIHLFDDVGVVMNYPSFSTLQMIRNSNMNNPEEAINVVMACMDYIYNTNEVFKIDDCPKEKLIEFIDNLTDTQLQSIKSFFKTSPKVYLDIEYTCPLCAVTHNKRLEGLASFF